MATATTTKKATTTATTTSVKYAKDDMIMCRSITSGKLFVLGEKSKTMYKWVNRDDVEGVEYQDLVYLVRSKDVAVFGPRIIVEDDEFVNQYPELRKLYDSMYTTGDLMEILNLPPEKMREVIIGLPNTIKESIKNLVATLIDEGSFDSAKRIKVIDEVFETKLLETLVNS